MYYSRISRMHLIKCTVNSNVLTITSNNNIGYNLRTDFSNDSTPRYGMI